jgi:hypothetical protein
MANLKSRGVIPLDLIATLTNLPRLQTQLRDMSQDVSTGIPESVAEVLEVATKALDLAEVTKIQPFLLVEATPEIPAGRSLTVGTGLSTTDGGGGGNFHIRLQAFLAALSLLSGNGIIAKTASGAELRTIEAGSPRIEVMNGNGATGNPAIDIDEPSLDLGNMGGMLGIDHGGTGVDVMSAFSADNNGVIQSIPSTAFTQVSLSNVVLNLNGNFSGGEWTPPPGRPVSIVGAVAILLSEPADIVVSVFKNGAEFRRGQQIRTASAGINVLLAHCIDLPNGTDAYTLMVYQGSGVAQSTDGDIANTYFQGSML